MDNKVEAAESITPKSSVVRATGVVAAVTLGSRVLGMIRDILIARYFGAGMATDAFFTAFKIPNLLRRLVAEGSLATAFVPVISDEMQKGRQAVKLALAQTMGFCLLLTIVLTTGGMIFSDEVIALFALGWTAQPEKLNLARDLLLVMFPYVIIISLTALCASALNALGYFAWAAASPAILNIAFITSIFAISDSLSQPIFSLSYALLIGGIAGLLPMILSLRKLGYGVIPKSPFRSAPVNRLVRLMAPAIISSSVYQIMVFINSILVTMLDEGAPSWLYFADRLFQFPLGVFSIAVATAVLPALSRLATKDDHQGFSNLLGETLAWVAFITIPASAGLILLSLPIVQVIYQSGEFSLIDSKNTSMALIGFAIGLWPLSTHTVLVRAFLAKKDTKTPAIVAICSILCNVLLAITLMGRPITPEANFVTKLISNAQNVLPVYSLGHVGLALASSLASVFSLVALMLFLSKHLSVKLNSKALIGSLSKTIVSTIAMCAILYFSSTLNVLGNPIATLVLNIILGIGAFFLTSVLLKSNEMQFTIRLMRK